MSAQSETPTPGRPTVVHLRARGNITVPPAVRESLGLEIDDQLILTVEHGRIVLTPATVVPRSEAPDPEGDKAAGRVEHFPNDESFVDSFHDPRLLGKA